ncbi:MAG: SDR family NAD(P)-dependent oxidoreductase [Aminivibrio sp.]|jgi:NAD(P)-dependent dehydrogenase (short-subunit alcohol dehydrogenase family)
MMGGYYRDKVAVVTGAASGMGLGLTEGMLARGAAAVFMADVKEENLNREAGRLEGQYPGRVFPALADVTKLDQVSALIGRARDFNGRLDFVFNNAGMGMTLPTEQITFEMWRFLVDLNIMGVVYGTYSAIPIMREQGSGHIVNTASAAGLFPIPYQAVYTATKAAVLSMTESLQYELETEGLSFTVFCPGNVATPLFAGVGVPADAVPVEEAVEIILGGVENKELLIAFPKQIQEIDVLYREKRGEFDKLMRYMAAERKENYRTKGTYI